MPIRRPTPGVVTPLPVTSYFTTFPTDENPLSEGGRWRVGSSASNNYQNPRTLSGDCFGANTSSGFDDCLAHVQGMQIPNNHRIDVTIRKTAGYTPPDSHEVGIYGRMVIGSQFVRGYEILIAFSPGAFQVIKWLGVATTFPENFTILSTSGNPPAVDDGDVFRVDFIGNVITCYRNGVLFNTTTDTDSPWLDGNPGMGFFIRPGTGADPSKYCIRDWMAQAA